ncbi:hypothetical protein ACHQM5_031034 [Ranunculus cassubicifolius]
MIGRADIEGSKSNVAMNAWLPQASYPCVDCSTPGEGHRSDRSQSIPRPARGDPLSPRKQLEQGCSPWRPDAVMSTTGRNWYSVLRIFKGRRGRTGHHATCGALPAAGPYLRLSRFQGGQADRLTHVQVPFTWNLSPLRPSKFSFEYLLLPPRSAPTAAPPGLAPWVSQPPLRPPTHQGLTIALTAGCGSRASAPSIFGAS